MTVVAMVANFGYFAVLVVNLVGEVENVYAFEPVPYTYEVLRNYSIRY